MRAVRIRVVRTGGFAGLRVEAEVDSEALEGDPRREAETILGAAAPHLMTPPRGGPSPARVPPGGADRMTYEVTVLGAPGARPLRGEEGTLPEAVEELARFVLRFGRRRPPPK